jgi:hypothetical protein
LRRADLPVQKVLLTALGLKTEVKQSVSRMSYAPSGNNKEKGRSIAEAVSRWLPTAATQVHAPVWSNGICGGQIEVGAGFVRALRSSLPILIPPNSPSSQSPGAGTVRQK